MSKTVYEQIKELTIPEMATLIAQMVDHETHPCSCPIGACVRNGNPENAGENPGYCGKEGCDVSAVDWLLSEDELFLDVPEYLWEDE